MGNRERNSYVTERIEEAVVELLRNDDLRSISVSQIVGAAQVSRNSFYRNYADKDDVLRHRVRRMLASWDKAYQSVARGSNAELYGSLFAHLKRNADFYLLLRKRGLFHLFREEFLLRWGPKPELDNASAYVAAFVAGGTLGWIDEWVERGMQESAKEMTALLVKLGM